MSCFARGLRFTGMSANRVVLLAVVGLLSGCSGAPQGPQSFDGGPGTLWVHLWDDTVVGIDTRDGRQVKRFDNVGAAQGGDGVLALGGGALWFQGSNGVRRLDTGNGTGTDVPGSKSTYPAHGAGAVWWAEEGTLASPNPIYRFDPASQTTSHTNAAGLPNGTGGLIAASADGCFSLFGVLSNLSRGVAHVSADGSTVTNITLPGAAGTFLGTSVIAGSGRGYVLFNTTATKAKRLYVIDAATNTITAQRDLGTPELGRDGLLANEDHLLFADGAPWYVDAYGEKFYELDPATLATRRAVSTGPTMKQAAVGAGGAWTGETRTLTRTDLATGAQVELEMPANIRAMVFEAP